MNVRLIMTGKLRRGFARHPFDNLVLDDPYFFHTMLVGSPAALSQTERETSTFYFLMFALNGSLWDVACTQQYNEVPLFPRPACNEC